GDKIASSLQLLLSYPFGDAVFNAVPGDYTGLKVTLNVDLRPGSPNNPLGPNGPFCGPNPLGVSLPKPSFCGTAAATAHPAAAAPPASGSPQTVVAATPAAGGLSDVIGGAFR